MADSPFDKDLPPYIDEAQTPNPFASPTSVESGNNPYMAEIDDYLNPWVSMWMRPRQTVRQMLNTEPTKYVLLLAALGGVSSAMDEVTEACIGEDLPFRIGVLAGCAIVGAIFGVVWLYVYGWATGLVGRWLDGVGTATELRTAIAWSQIPSIWLLPINFGFAAAVAILGPENMFAGMAEAVQAEGGFDISMFPPWILALAAGGIIIGLWQIVITCQSVGEAHQFSSGKGFVTLLLSGLMLGGIVILIVLPFVLIFAAVS